jgi:hypothetical protein
MDPPRASRLRCRSDAVFGRCRPGRVHGRLQHRQRNPRARQESHRDSSYPSPA